MRKIIRSVIKEYVILKDSRNYVDVNTGKNFCQN